MSPNVISVIALCISAVSVLGALAGIWWHCKQDHERAGMMWERSESHRKRLDLLERQGDER
jgi:hypothetical protein